MLAAHLDGKGGKLTLEAMKLLRYLLSLLRRKPQTYRAVTTSWSGPLDSAAWREP